MLNFRMRNEKTGDVIELPPPDILGFSVVRFNGRVVERVLYSDELDSVTTEDGRVFRVNEWSRYVAEQLRIGAYREEGPDPKLMS